MGKIFNRVFTRWSIGTVKKRLLKLEHVFDVLYEQPKENKYLVHVFVNGLTERLEDIMRPGIKSAVGRLPEGVKVDVLLYQIGD